MTSSPYDLIAERFRAVRTRLAPKEAEYLALLLEPLAPGGTILDLGCGTGHPIAAHVASRGHRVVGVDASDAMLAIARRELPGHRWIRGAIEQLEFEETFDAVICWDALFHLPRRHVQPTVTSIHRWLAAGGRLMVSSGGSVDEHPGGFTDTMFGHEFFYDSLPPGQMVATIEEAGFDILVAEMCEPPGGGRDRGKWATVAAKKP